MLDLANDYHVHIGRRLRTEPIIWLATANMVPHLVPMWFLWDGEGVTLFSLPSTQKLRNLAANPNVSLALDAADQGYDIVILHGRAALIDDPRVSGLMPAFVEKYASIPRRWPPTEWAKRFSQAIRVVPTHLIGWMTNPCRPIQRVNIRVREKMRKAQAPTV